MKHENDLNEKKVNPDSGVGKAMIYMLSPG